MRENGEPLDVIYTNFEMLCVEWSRAPTNRELVEIDEFRRVVRIFTTAECRIGAQRAGSRKGST
jgi:hypothetical protein